MLDRTLRQQLVLQSMMESRVPVTGQDLAELCGVTRQVVVQDIALLRAIGHDIVSTPRGYVLEVTEALTQRAKSVLTVCHSAALTETELLILVDYGITIHDVVIEHPIYGELRGGLRLSSRRDVELFIQQVSTSKASLLSSLTDGFHIHTIEAPNIDRIVEAKMKLTLQGIQVFD